MTFSENIRTDVLIQKIHFIGIGGIGVSALAKFYLSSRTSSSIQVSGSDLQDSETLDQLRKLGAKIYLGHRAKNLPKDADLVIYSAAVPENNPELKEAKKRGIKCQTYSQALGDLTKKYFTIAVSGMHGKSTTTSMVALILIKAGLDPTVIVGTKLQEFGDSNFRLGKGKYLVIEADEWNASFLNYWPKIIVLTNIEEEHLDYYKDLNHILKTFKQYIGYLPEDGVLVINGDDLNISKINPVFNTGQKSKTQFKIQNYNSKCKIKDLKLKIPGRHNLMNAFAAIFAARALRIPDRISVKALNNFRGTRRRFEYKGMVNGAKIYDDYAHHPTEIRATLQAAKEFLTKNYKLKTKKQLWCVFQSHQYQRTYKLFNQFVNAFEQADKIVLLPIYSVAGREKESIKRKISSKKLAEAINKNQKVIYLNSFKKAADYLRKNLKRGDIAIIMGAGDVYQLTERVIHS